MHRQVGLGFQVELAAAVHAGAQRAVIWHHATVTNAFTPPSADQFLLAEYPDEQQRAHVYAVALQRDLEAEGELAAYSGISKDFSQQQTHFIALADIVTEFMTRPMTC